MTLGRSVIPAALIALVALMLPCAGASQQMITLEGMVRDEFQGIANAQVTAFDSLTNERRSAITNARGFFRMLDLGPGRYAVTARMIGHAPVTTPIRLAVGERAHVELVLQRNPELLETVQVREQSTGATGIQRMTVSTAVTVDEIRNLPLNSRHVMDLAAVTPGIRSFRPIDGRSLPASGPLRDERAINLYLDGVEMKNLNTGNVTGTPQTGSPLPADALQEFSVMLNTYDAEFTRGSAYVMSAVTHRGTNERHGSAFGFFQNKDLVSVTDFQRRIPNFDKPDFSRRQAGFSVRGPFVRDRLFYALTYELSDTDDFIAVVPGRPAVDPGVWDEYAGAFNAPNRNHTGVLRLTWAANDANLFETIWSSRYMTGESLFGGTDAHEAGVAQQYNINTVKVRHRWLPTQRIANELSVQFVGWSHEDRPLFAGPEFRYPTVTIGRAGFIDIDERQLRVADRLTYSFGSGPGSHLVKAGLEVGRVTGEQFSPLNGQGAFSFRTETGQPYEGLIGVGALHPESRVDAVAGIVGWVAAGYVNDEWQPTSRLVVNMGVRYDIEINTLNNDFTVPWAADTIMSSKPELRGLLNQGNRKNDINNIAPRISFSWDALGNRRTFIRGGLGIMYDRTPGFIALNERRSATWRTYAFANPGTLDADELRRRVLEGGGTALPPSIVLLPNRIETPENRQLSLGVGSRLADALALNVDYVHQDIRKLWTNVNLNWINRSTTPARRVLTSAYGNINAHGDNGRARYRALLTSLSYSPDPGRRLTLAHTLASAKADWDVESGAVPAASASDYYVLQRVSGDERNRFVLSGMWPVTHGFSVSAIATVASPRPYKSRVGQDLNRNNFLDDDWIDGSRFQLPENAFRNWYRMLDVRLTKAFGLGRGVRLSVTAEAFNLFNTENHAGYFGVQKSDTGEPRPDFGAPDGIFAARQFQLGTRLDF